MLAVSPKAKRGADPAPKLYSFTKSETWSRPSTKASSFFLMRFGVEGHVAIFIDFHLHVHRFSRSDLDHADPEFGIQNLCGHLHSLGKFCPSHRRKVFCHRIAKTLASWSTKEIPLELSKCCSYYDRFSCVREYFADISHCLNLRLIEPQFVVKFSCVLSRGPMGRNNPYFLDNFTSILSSFARTNGPQQSNTDQQSLGHLVFFRADQWAATTEKKTSYHRLREPMGRNVFVTNILTCIFYLVCTDQRTGQPECIYFVFSTHHIHIGWRHNGPQQCAWRQNTSHAFVCY